jgi:methionyl-tRNA formyltransferase
VKNQRPIRLVLLSSTVFGYKCLREGIMPIPHVQVKGILTTSSQIEISYSEKPVELITHVDFSDLADQIGCEAVTLRGKINSASYLDHITRWQPDLLLVLGWYYMVPGKVRDSVPLGCVGIHASLLPKYRGGAPIPWAIINGDTETGVSFFYADDGVDSGDIISQIAFDIEENDTCATVYEKATLASIKILQEYIPRIAAGTAPRVAQDETQATYFPQRKPEDGLIDWSWNAKRVRNFIRAQTRPYPGAFTFIEGKKVVIWDADINESGEESTNKNNRHI